MSVKSVKAVAMKTAEGSAVKRAEAAPVKPSGSAMESTKISAAVKCSSAVKASASPVPAALRRSRLRNGKECER
jgi:hypothetical protein